MSDIDVIVVGAGAAGIAAAIAAKESGARTIILEKGPNIGWTNTCRAGGNISIAVENRLPRNRTGEKKDFYKNLEGFYLMFLKNLRKKLKKKAVIVFPNYVNYKKILKLSRFKIENEFSIYVHRSLTRKIVKIK